MEAPLSPYAWRLTPSEDCILACLLARETATRDQIMDALYEDRNGDEPAEGVLGVFLCKLRKKLKPLEISIQTRYGVGWALSPEAKAILRRLIAEANAPAREAA